MSILSETDIITDSGWKKCNHLNENDILFNSDGKPVKIRKISEENKGTKLNEIIFSDDSNLIISSDVSLPTLSAKEREQTRRLSDEFREKRKKTRGLRGKGIRPDLVLSNKNRTYEYKEKPIPKYRTVEEIKETIIYRVSHKNHSILVNKPI